MSDEIEKLKFRSRTLHRLATAAKSPGVIMNHCQNCPIKGTEFCHRVNPKAKKYTLSEKEEIRKCLLTKADHTKQ